MSPALQTQFAEYAQFHRTSGNQACHSVGIPLIVFAILALLAHVPLAAVGGFTVTLAEVVVVAFLLFNLTLDPFLAVLMLVASAVLAAAGRFVSVPVALALFVAGWILQFVGHYVYEKRAPAFFRNFMHLLVGPLWILAKAVGRG